MTDLSIRYQLKNEGQRKTTTKQTNIQAFTDCHNSTGKSNIMIQPPRRKNMKVCTTGKARSEARMPSVTILIPARHRLDHEKDHRKRKKWDSGGGTGLCG